MLREVRPATSKTDLAVRLLTSLQNQRVTKKKVMKSRLKQLCFSSLNLNSRNFFMMCNILQSQNNKKRMMGKNAQNCWIPSSIYSWFIKLLSLFYTHDSNLIRSLFKTKNHVNRGTEYLVVLST